MTTSGTWNYNITAKTVITASLEDIGVIANGQPIDPNDLSTSLRTLNLLAKQWQGRGDKFPGLKEWQRQRLAVFFAKGQVSYNVGPASTDDRATVLQSSSQSNPGSSFQATSLTAARLANDTVTKVASSSGMTALDQFGINLSDGTLGWTTIASVDSATQVTLAANTLGAANNSAVVFSYTAKAQRFVDIETAVLRDYSNLAQPIDIGVQIYTDVQQYEAVTQKGASGDPTAVLVEFQRLNTRVTCNFATANVFKMLRLSVLYPSENYDDATGADDIAYPQEYYAALEWELARRLSAKFGRTWTPDMEKHWTIAVQEGINFNPEDTHLCFEPGRDDTDVGSPFTRP